LPVPAFVSLSSVGGDNNAGRGSLQCTRLNEECDACRHGRGPVDRR
jgi:hypothetical protein